MTDTHPHLHYTKSSRSGGSGGNCVEWAFTPDRVFVRDSKNPTGPALRLTPGQWTELLTATAAGRQHPWISRGEHGTTVSKDNHRLTFTVAEWAAFIDAAISGECASRV